MLDDGCTVEGYQSDITRTFVFGKPSDKMKQVFEIVHRAQTAALKAARPGVECQAVDAAARKVITDAGYGPDYKYFTHRVGHGIGMDGHEWPYLVRGNTTPLARGMTFSDEPGIYIPGEFGVRLEDDMHITENGAELFTPPKPVTGRSVRNSVTFQNELRFRHRGTSRETQHVGVPYIAEVFDPNLAGEKSVGGHLSQECEELHALTYLWILISVLADKRSDREFLFAARVQQSR